MKHALWKDASDNGVTNIDENRQSKRLTILLKRTWVPCDNLGRHFEL